MEVGISFLQGLGKNHSCDDSASQLVDRALEHLPIDEGPVRLAMLLATADWCEAHAALPRTFRDCLKKHLGYEVPLIGGSMAKLYCSTAAEPLIDDGLVLVTFCSEEFWASVESLHKPHECPEKQKSRLEELKRKLEDTPRIRLGISAERYLMGFFPGYFRDKKGDCRYYDSELYHELLKAFDYDYQLIGGAACNNLRPTVGYQFANDELLESGLAVALIETGLGYAIGMSHGFHPHGRECVSVDRLVGDEESGYEIAELDGKPAAKRLDELKKICLWPQEQPILGRLVGADYRLIVPLFKYKAKDGVIALNRKVNLGDRLYVMRASVAEMQQASEDAIEQAFSRKNASPDNLKLITVFSCAGRFEEYRRQNTSWVETAKRIRKNYPGVPMVGMLCSGEFGSDIRHQQRANNMSVSICGATDTRAPQLETRQSQATLLEVAEQLAECESPEELMHRALEGAVRAGATGGMICLVDRGIGKILGLENVGYALSSKSKGLFHDWDAVAKLTKRPMPEKVGGEFPSDLREWSIPVQHGVSLDYVHSLVEEEDILTFIVRVLHAVFVANVSDEKFLCDRKAAEAGRIRTFLAIPLIGSKEDLQDGCKESRRTGSDVEAIATLQVSFPDGELIDQESFGFWIGYAQKVGAALKRTQEVWERRIREEVGTVGDKLLQTPVNLDLGPWEWCDKYLDVVREAIGADDVHMRVLVRRRPGDPEAYRLVGAVGPSAESRRRTRSVTYGEEGSCNIDLLRGGGEITNTKEESTELNRNVKAIEDIEAYGQKFSRELAALEACAMLPIYHEGEIHGSFCIDSLQPFFFTERRQRIARALANLAGAIHHAKVAEYGRRKLEKEQTWMLQTLTRATEGLAEERLRRLLARVCSEVKADVASLYVWYDECEKLVLNVAHNWYKKDMEGIAFFRRDEGWTGELLAAEDDVSIVHTGSVESRMCATKYYDKMVPRKHRVKSTETEARIGVRLCAGTGLVGVVTFSYFRRHAERLVEQDTEVVALLRGVTHLITLGVEAAAQENARSQAERLLITRNAVTKKLIAAATPGATWQPVMDEIRNGFEVARVTLYHLEECRIYHAWTSLETAGAVVDTEMEPLKPSGALLDLIRDKTELLIKSDGIQRLTEWPNTENVRTLYAVPVLSSEGETCGVLEFVNRIPTREHPFEFLDKDERLAVVGVASSMGAAIDHGELVRSGSELRSQIETAVKIGTTSLLGGLVMHRLMAPFSRSQQSIDWLRMRPHLTIEEGIANLNRIQAANNEALEMVQQTAFRGKVGVERTNLRTIVRAAVRVVQPDLPSAGVEVRVSSDIDAVVHLDLFSVVGALVNFLSNAIEAMKGAGTLTIRTELTHDESAAIIRIHNTGRALGESEIKQAFAPGFTTKPGEHHFGIGIPLAVRAIESAHGTVRMHSPGQDGVEVEVTLPVANKPRP